MYRYLTVIVTATVLNWIPRVAIHCIRHCNKIATADTAIHSSTDIIILRDSHKMSYISMEPYVTHAQLQIAVVQGMTERC